MILFHRSVLGTEFRGELEDTLMITEVGINLLQFINVAGYFNRKSAG